MKGYELARAEIDRRGNGEETQGVEQAELPGQALFKGKPAASDEDDEGAAPAPAKNEKPSRSPSSQPPPNRPRSPPSPLPRPCSLPPPTPRSSRRQRQDRFQPSRPPSPKSPSRSRKPSQPPARSRPPTSSMPAASGTMSPPRSRQARPRSPPSTPAGPLPQPIRSRPPASATTSTRRWPTRPPPPRRSIAPISLPPLRRSRAAPGPATPPKNAMAVNDVTTVVAKGAQGQSSSHRHLDPARRVQGRQRCLDARDDAGARAPRPRCR